MNPSNAALSDEQFVEIGGYIRARFHQWLLEDRELNSDAVSGQLNRIESSLESSVVLARARFDMGRLFCHAENLSHERLACHGNWPGPGTALPETGLPSGTACWPIHAIKECISPIP